MVDNKFPVTNSAEQPRYANQLSKRGEKSSEGPWAMKEEASQGVPVNLDIDKRRDSNTFLHADRLCRSKLSNEAVSRNKNEGGCLIKSDSRLPSSGAGNKIGKNNNGQRCPRA